MEPHRKRKTVLDCSGSKKDFITPGTTIVFTNNAVDPTTQSPTGFQIVVAQKDKPTGTVD
jgi:hypothetical protein